MFCGVGGEGGTLEEIRGGGGSGGGGQGLDLGVGRGNRKGKYSKRKRKIWMGSVAETGDMVSKTV